MFDTTDKLVDTFFAQAETFVEKLKAKHIEVNQITTNQIIVVRST